MRLLSIDFKIRNYKQILSIMSTGKILSFYISRNMVDNISCRIYYSPMEHNDAAKRLAELGNTTRLAIFRYLVKRGHRGAPVGQIQKELNIPGSTLSHHISRLVSVDLIRQVRESRTRYCIPQYQRLDALIAFLQSECCTVSDCPSPGVAGDAPGS
jgi:ArsR family transcriptional regulator, arsenate/arsenite/antimonite-responsive transcriptional repressor